MDYNQNIGQPMPSGQQASPESKNMLWAWIGFAVVFAGFSLAFYYFFGYEPASQQEEKKQAAPTAEDKILDELEGVNLDDLDAELADIEKELAQ
jgi:flagellar basal body-associated protein FliL